MAQPQTAHGPVLTRKGGYHGPHAVPEEGIARIVDMLRKGDLFRYGGSDEGSMQVRAVNPAASCSPMLLLWAMARATACCWS